MTRPVEGKGFNDPRIQASMNKKELQSFLDSEIEEWSRKPFTPLTDELTDVVAYGPGDKPDYHQFEAQIVDQKPDCLHVIVSIDDGRFLRSFAPLTRNFIVYSDGRVDK